MKSTFIRGLLLSTAVLMIVFQNSPSSCEAKVAEVVKEGAKAAAKKLHSSKVFFDIMIG